MLGLVPRFKLGSTRLDDYRDLPDQLLLFFLPFFLLPFLREISRNLLQHILPLIDALLGLKGLL